MGCDWFMYHLRSNYQNRLEFPFNIYKCKCKLHHGVYIIYTVCFVLFVEEKDFGQTYTEVDRITAKDMHSDDIDEVDLLKDKGQDWVGAWCWGQVEMLTTGGQGLVKQICQEVVAVVRWGAIHDVEY